MSKNENFIDKALKYGRLVYLIIIITFLTFVILRIFKVI